MVTAGALLAVILIIGILMTFLVPKITSSVRAANVCRIAVHRPPETSQRSDTLVVLSVFPHNEHLAMITAGLLYSPLLIRVTQAQARGVREQLYVAAARVSAARNGPATARCT